MEMQLIVDKRTAFRPIRGKYFSDQSRHAIYLTSRITADKASNHILEIKRELTLALS